MTKKQIIANKTDSGKKSAASDLPKRRKTEQLPDGLYYFEDDLKIKNVLKANVITCTGWLLEFLKIGAGEISFFSDGEEIRPFFRNLAIFYPPFSITQPCFKNVRANLKGIAGNSVLPSEFSPRPFVFETDFAKSPKTLSEVLGILQSSREIRFVEAYPKVSLLSLKAKKLIDENYRVFPSIARIAARLDVSHEHLTRQFKSDFGMSPNAYLHQIRIADASFRLVKGEKIIEVSGDVGYNDLSRFYKQFRKSTNASPGSCQEVQK